MPIRPCNNRHEGTHLSRPLRHVGLSISLPRARQACPSDTLVTSPPKTCCRRPFAQLSCQRFTIGYETGQRVGFCQGHWRFMAFLLH